MKLRLMIILLLFSINALACDKIVEGYQKSDGMFVICDDLSALSTDDVSELIINLFNQYQGPPDEISIFFVSSSEFVGDRNLTDDNLVGFYYTHDNNLIIWPNSNTNKRIVQIIWK